MTFRPYQKEMLAVNFCLNAIKVKVVPEFVWLGIVIDSINRNYIYTKLKI